jgi:ribonuclease BN (tRNA processing enzyme)
MALVSDSHAFSLTVLGCNGSYGAPVGGACSGYLVRAGGTTLWVDCGNGTFANLQRHADPASIDAVVITHAHPDHCVDIYGLHVLNKYWLERFELPVYAPEGVEKTLATLVGDDWGGAFDWQLVRDGDHDRIGDVDLRFSRTDHPPPTMAVELRRAGTRLVYTSDTGLGWSPEAFGAGADFVLSEATYKHDDLRAPIHLSAFQAGEVARAAGAQRLAITHIWPTFDHEAHRREAETGFEGPVELAAVDQEFLI